MGFSDSWNSLSKTKNKKKQKTPRIPETLLRVKLGWNERCVCAQSCPTLCDPMDCSHQAPLSMGFSSQEYWNRLPCPPSRDLPDPGIKPTSPVAPALQADSLPLSRPGKPSLPLERCSPPPSHLSRSSQSTGAELPVFYSNLYRVR